jgi:hypothetical protein
MIPTYSLMFERGRVYTRKQISAALGGGEQDYLPHADGRVVCGAFSRDLNPKAPSVVLPGTGPDIERWARVFAEQEDAVPVFVKRRVNEWTYMGHYRCLRLDDGPVAIEAEAQRTGRTDISMVLYIERDRAAES